MEPTGVTTEDGTGTTSASLLATPEPDLSDKVDNVISARRVVRLPHLEPLDGLRGVAVALVVLVHSGNSLWPEAKDWLARGGPLGVHLFFVLSGFLITALLLSEHQRSGRIDLRAFARRRILRLGPAIVALLLALLVVAATGPRLQVSAVLAYGTYDLLFVANLRLVHGDFPPVTWLFGTDYGGLTEVGHMWSVGVEAQFYVFWALTLWTVTRLRWSYTRIAWLAVGLIAAVAAWRAYLLWSGEPWLRLYLAPSTRLDAPLVGSLVGVAYCAGWLPRVPKRVATTAAVIGLAAFLTAAFTIILDARVLYFGLYTVLALCGAAAIVGVVRAPGDRLAAVLSWRPLVFLGALSYSVYIWHYGIFYWFERHDPSWPGPVVLLVGNGVTLAVSWVSWRWIERPFLRLKSRRTGSVAPTPV